ncbi:MAG: T9SS type A sorting domain-containing protein [Flavobacteriaceae bacterium]|nr:T9SS type A sorting domain-containing protein [Flavobacteriaceae bacterium]
MHKQLYFIVFTIIFSSFFCSAQVQIQLPDAPTLYQIPKDLRGDNISANTNIDWLNNTAFETKFNILKYGIFRWPGGTSFNNFDWRAHLQENGKLNLKFAAQFANTFNLNIIYMLNYGNTTALEAAELVKFANSTNAIYQQERLQLLGNTAPLNIKKWELGNEIGSSWTWGVSWVAGGSAIYFRTGAPQKAMPKTLTDSLYYFGGDIWREGWVPQTGQITKLEAILGTKQQLASAKDTLILKVGFPTIIKDSIRVWVTNSSFTKNELDTNFTQQELYDLFTEPTSRLSVSEYEVLGDSAVKIFPNNQMQINNVALVEYKSFNHDGAFAIRDAMIAADTSIEIGYVLIFTDALLNSTAFTSRLIQSPPRFLIRHNYNGGLDNFINNSQYSEIVHTAEDVRINSFEVIQSELNTLSATLNINPKIGLAVTEWNILICETCPKEDPYQGIISGLYTANYWLQMYEASKIGSIDMRAVTRFALLASGDNLLHLLHYRNPTQIDSTAQYLATRMVNEVVSENFFTIAPSAITNNPFITIEAVSGTVQKPALQIYGGFNSSSSSYNLIILNIDDENAHNITLNIPANWHIKSAETELLTGNFLNANLQSTLTSLSINNNTLSINSPAFSLLKVNLSTDVLSINNFSSKIDVNIYPNPIKDIAHISIKNYTGQFPIHFKIFDITGKNLLQKNDINTPTFIIEPHTIKSGLYLFSITSSEGIFRGKLIIK